MTGSRRHRVQLVLFLAAVFVPCALLIALSLRIVNQDRELRVKRQQDEQRQVVDRAAAELSSLLNAVQRDESLEDLPPGQTYRHAETVLVAWSDGDRLVLPWEPERDRTARRCRDLISQPGFQTAIRACGQADQACFQHLAGNASDPVQAAYARWLLARTQAEAGRVQQALPLFRDLLQVGPDVTDEDGVPLQLHAAQSLVSADAFHRELVAAVESVLSSRPWLPPLSSYVVSDISQRLARVAKEPADTRDAEELRRKAAAYIHTLQQAEALQNDFARVRSQLPSSTRTAWLPFGDDPWLVAATGNAIVVVRAAAFLPQLRTPGALRFADARDPEGLPMGDSLPGLKLVLASAGKAAPDPAVDLQRSIFLLTLLFVVAATVFGAYLLWRDLQRDMRLSDLRAQFVSSVSHELKTPLTSIRMFAETLQMGRINDPEVRDEYLGTIVNESERLSRLVDGVLLFSKVEQGKRTYRFRPVQAGEVIRSAVRTMEYPLSQQGFHLHLTLEPDLPAIHADRDAVEQAVLNLLSNALKFSGEARDIDLRLFRDQNEIVIRVTDRGLGIAPEQQSRIFEKFYRAPTSQNQLIPGTGLGLALVAAILKAHGGRVEVDSEAGKGSTFSLRFPVQTGSLTDQEVTA